VVVCGSLRKLDDFDYSPPMTIRIGLPAILVYEDYLLANSQTFVRSQAESFERFTPYYVGARHIPHGLSLPADRCLILNRGNLAGGVREVLFRFAGIAPGLVRKLRKLHPVLVHAHFGPDGLNGVTLARALKVPLIVTHHGYDVTTKAEFPISRWHKRYLRRRPFLQRNANLFLAVSHYIKGRLVEQGFPEARVRVHYVGVDTAKFKPTAPEEREQVVLFVGRLVENKGCSFLLRAMHRVRQQCPNARLAIIGDGPLRQQLEAEAAVLVSEGCSFLGEQAPDAVRYWMGRARVLCVPCVTSKTGVSEAFGLVFIEAQAMGLPVVSFANGGVPEAVADNETGFLSPAEDVEHLAASVVRLLQDSSLWNRFSQAGVDRVRTRFDLSAQSNELEKLYDQVVAEYGKQSESSAPLPVGSGASANSI
jgi:colanic acid/amylovoran biosynthesis glycosyltransferase